MRFGNVVQKTKLGFGKYGFPKGGLLFTIQNEIGARLHIHPIQFQLVVIIAPTAANIQNGRALRYVFFDYPRDNCPKVSPDHALGYFLQFFDEFIQRRRVRH